MDKGWKLDFFYSKFGFIPFPENRKMFLTLATIEQFFNDY